MNQKILPLGIPGPAPLRRAASPLAGEGILEILARLPGDSHGKVEKPGTRGGGGNRVAVHRQNALS